MAFTPILVDKTIDYARYRTAYRNSARESSWGSPVFFTPSNWPANTYGGYGGPRYGESGGYNYDESPYTSDVGNCTWWCEGRVYETQGTHHGGMGNAVNWYDNYSGSKSRNANNVSAGDVIVLSDGGYGHVMFVEQVDRDGTVHISQSAASSRVSVWNGYACRVGSYAKSAIYQGNTIDMYKDISGQSAYNLTVVGIIHTGGGSPGPEPPTPTEEPSVTVYPSAYDSIMLSTEDYIDFNFTVVVEGIPIDEDASGAISFSSNCYRRMYTSNWTYTEYVIDGVRYLTGRRSLIVRYDRLHDYAYYDTAYMYYRKTFSNGSVNSATRMGIQIEAKETEDEIISIIAYLLNRRKKRVKYKIK